MQNKINNNFNSLSYILLIFSIIFIFIGYIGINSNIESNKIISSIVDYILNNKFLDGLFGNMVRNIYSGPMVLIIDMRYVPDVKSFGIINFIFGFIFICLFIYNSNYKLNILISNYLRSKFKFNYNVIILSIIILSGLILRFNNFNHQIDGLHSMKQSEIAANVYHYINDGFEIKETLLAKNSDLNFISFPFYQWLIVILVKATNLDIIIAGKIINILFYILTCILLINLLKILKFNENVIIFSVFIYAWTPLNIFFERTIHPDPMVVYF